MVACARPLLAKCRCAYDDHHIRSEGGSPYSNLCRSRSDDTGCDDAAVSVITLYPRQRNDRQPKWPFPATPNVRRFEHHWQA